MPSLSIQRRELREQMGVDTKTHKYCSQCGEAHLREEFGPYKGSKDGLLASCRASALRRKKESGGAQRAADRQRAKRKRGGLTKGSVLRLAMSMKWDRND